MKVYSDLKENEFMSQHRSKLVSVVMFVVTCVFGFLYAFMAAFTAIPVCVARITAVDATMFDKFNAIWTLLTVVAPIILALIAYTLNFNGSGQIGFLFGLAMLALNLSKGIDWSSAQLFFRSLTDITIPFLIISYSISEGEYRQRVVWLLIAIGLCLLRAYEMIVVIVVLGSSVTVREVVMGVACIFTHLCAFLAFIPSPGHQLAECFFGSSQSSIETYKRAIM